MGSSVGSSVGSFLRYICWGLAKDLRKMLFDACKNPKIMRFFYQWSLFSFVHLIFMYVKDVPGGFPKSDLLGVTVALIHVVGQQILAV